MIDPAHADPRYGKPQPRWPHRLLASSATLFAAILCAVFLIGRQP